MGKCPIVNKVERMRELQLKAIEPQVYERLIDRLSLALEVARTAVRLRDEVPVELELRGLSRAEFELIHAYLNAGGANSRGAMAAPISRDAGLPAKVVWLEQVRAKKLAGASQARRKR